MTEDAYLSEVYRIADDADVFVHHCNDPRRCHGTGFLDLVLIGSRGVIWREVKAGYGHSTTPSQTSILYRLRGSGHDARVWKTADLLGGIVADEIARIH